MAIAAYEEKQAPKEAGFVWHYGEQCRRGPKTCYACRVGLKRAWWTRKHEKAARLSSYCDDLALKALRPHLRAVESSRATDAELEIPAPEGKSYFGYQRAGISYLHNRDGVLLGDEQGLGKTIQVIGAINVDPTIENVLCICPATLRLNWQREAQRWLVPDDRKWKFEIVDSDTPVRSSSNFVIVHYHRITIGERPCQECGGERRKEFVCPGCEGTGKGVREPLLCDICTGKKTVYCPKCRGRGKVPATNLKIVESLRQRQWDLLVADEAHFVKNPQSARSKAVLGKGGRDGLADRARKRFFLTGTPIPNRPIEIWPIISKLCPKEFNSMRAFTSRYCNGREEWVSKTKKIWRFDGASNLSELQERLRSTCMLRRLKSEVLKELPPKRRQVISLPPTREAKRLISEEMEIWEKKFGQDMELAEAAMSLAQEENDTLAYQNAVSKLKYIQGVAFMEMGRVRRELALVKVPMTIRHIESMFEEGVEKIVCFAHHKEAIRDIQKRFRDISVSLFGATKMADRQKAIDGFQENEAIKLFIGGITAAGTGITLTASSNVVFHELDWTPGTISQCEDRTHRIGQPNSVLIQHLVLDGSLDARMAQMLIEKQQIADQALDESTDISSEEHREAFRAEAPPEPVELWKKIALKEAMELLAKRRDPTTEGPKGFSSFDSIIGQKLATRKRTFSDKEAHLALKLAIKYHRQVQASNARLAKQLEIYREPEPPEEDSRKSKSYRDRQKQCAQIEISPETERALNFLGHIR